VITSFEVCRSTNGWFEERSSINNRGAASRIFERLATLYAVAASRNRLQQCLLRIHNPAIIKKNGPPSFAVRGFGAYVTTALRFVVT
jgi:hypothetical protein